MITFTGPKIAMLVASGSFLSIAATVMTISQVSPQTLRKAHYTKMDIYGKDTITKATKNQILASNIVDANKKFKCYWSIDASNSDKGYFECFIKQASTGEVKKGGKASCADVDVQTYKITAERSKLTEKINKKIIIEEVENKKQYATIQVVFSIDGELVK